MQILMNVLQTMVTVNTPAQMSQVDIHVAVDLVLHLMVMEGPVLKIVSTCTACSFDYIRITLYLILYVAPDAAVSVKMTSFGIVVALVLVTVATHIL